MVIMRLEVSSERWRRWDEYLLNDQPELVIEEYKKLITFQEPTYGDARRREKALTMMNVTVLRLRRPNER